MESIIHLDWQVEFNSGIPVYKQIINHVAAALASGLLKEGDRLPTIRALHEHLDVNPNTVAKAYRELELKGIISSERGSGSFVKAGPEPAAISPEERAAICSELYQRMLAEAAARGVAEPDMIRYIYERNQP